LTYSHSMEQPITQGVVTRLGVKNSHKGQKGGCGLPKLAVAQLDVSTQGCLGDYNQYRTIKKKSTSDRALSLITEDVIAQLNEEGWPVQAGDLGENITINGIPYEELQEGMSFVVGSVRLVLTEEIEPCNKLLHLPYVGRARRKEFMTTLTNRRGWYAKVDNPGIIKEGDVFKCSNDLTL